MWHCMHAHIKLIWRSCTYTVSQILTFSIGMDNELSSVPWEEDLARDISTLAWRGNLAQLLADMKGFLQI